MTHEPRLSDETDSHGNQVEGWGDPVEVPVYGWATPGSDQASRPEMSGVERDLDLYAKHGFTGARDRVTVQGLLYETVGYPEDYNHGPFGYFPGVRINLRRVEG